MIAAKYLDAITRMLTISPVTRVQPVSPQGKSSGQSNQEPNSSFSDLLISKVHAGDTNQTNSAGRYSMSPQAAAMRAAAVYPSALYTSKLLASEPYPQEPNGFDSCA